MNGSKLTKTPKAPKYAVYLLFILRFVFVAAVSHVYENFGTYVGCMLAAFTKLIYHACNYCVLDFFLRTTYYLLPFH